MQSLLRIWILTAIIASPSARAAILWMGSEDLDFPLGAPILVNTTAGTYRAGYARESLSVATGVYGRSNPLPGGPVTSVWISARIYSSTNNGATRILGLGKSGTNNGLWISTASFNGQWLGLYKYDGTTQTLLANAGAQTVPGTGLVNGPVVMHVINYGASGTVEIYNSTNLSAGPILTYNGDITSGGATNLDQVIIYGNGVYYSSEIIVSDVDPRYYSLATLAPNAAGDLNQWTNTYTNVNPTTINDTNFISDNTSGDKFQTKMNSVPAGTFTVAAVKIAARGATFSGGMGSMSVGIKTNGTVYAPAAIAQTGSFGLTETYYTTNPFTSAAWTTTDVNALQINLQSAP